MTFDRADGEAPIGVEARSPPRRWRSLREALVADEGRGLAVVDDVGDLGSDQVVVDRREVPTCLHRREVEGEHLGAVGQHRGHDVARGQAERAEPVHEAVAQRRRARRRSLACPAGSTSASRSGWSCASFQNPTVSVMARRVERVSSEGARTEAIGSEDNSSSDPCTRRRRTRSRLWLGWRQSHGGSGGAMSRRAVLLLIVVALFAASCGSRSEGGDSGAPDAPDDSEEAAGESGATASSPPTSASPTTRSPSA